MELLKCNLYIISGGRHISKSIFNNLLSEFINQSLDMYDGKNWIIRASRYNIEVEIFEFNNFDFSNFLTESKDTKNIVLYITEFSERKQKNHIHLKEIEQLKAISSKTTIIILPTFIPFEKEINININNLKKLVPFVEYFLPRQNSEYREYDSLFQMVYVLRKILINTQSKSLSFAKKLIRENFETKNPFLDLGNLGLTSLNDVKELFHNTHLKTLILSNEWGEYEEGRWIRKTSENKIEPNILFGIPHEIVYLKNLETLIAGGNWRIYKSKTRYFSSNWHITNIEPLSSLKKLSCLNLSNNEIESFIPLSNLSSLTKLYLNNNLINNFPKIDNFPRLEELYLSNNQIHTIKFLSSAKTIQTIDLHSNQITDLTPITDLISKIDIKDSKWENKTISISRNPLSIPPIEVVAKGKQNVLAYFNQFEAEKKIQIKPFQNTDIKLIMVGNSNVGKSTFVHWLQTGNVDRNIATTHWLEFGTLNTQRNGKNYTVRIFDFGGQEYYHDTHHLFFTNSTAYTLLWDMFSNNFDEIEINQTQNNGKKEKVKIETFPLEYWLDSIRYHTKKRKLTQTEKSITKILDEREAQIQETFTSKSNWLKSEIESSKKILEFKSSEEENILVLQNKVDSKKSKVFINEASLKKSYPKIYDFEEISIYNSTKLELCKDIIFDIFDSLEVLNGQYLGTWNYIKQSIENQTFNKSFSTNEFLDYCNEIIRNLPELVGKSQSRQNEVLFSLEDSKVFASFLADIGLCLYYPDNNELMETIFLNQEQIRNDVNKILLAINRSTGEITENEIANSLKEGVTSNKVKDVITLMLHFKILFRHPLNNKKSFIAPLYLPQIPPKSILLFQSLFETPVYRFNYETFIHKSVILDFFHTYGSKALSETSDESSFYFWKNGIVIKDENSNDIVKVEFVPWNNKNKCACLNIYAVNGTNDKFIDTIVDYIDSINEGINVTKLVPNESHKSFIPLEIIHQNEKAQNPIFYFDNKYYRLTSFKKYLKSPLKMKKIFISYSKQDYGLVEKFIEHLSALKIDGKVAHWFCSELEAGTVWNDEIQKNMEEADIICFMVSSNFMRTDYIHEHEIKKAFELKSKDPSLKLVPIILNYCHWTTINNNLGDFTALPYLAKPIVDFKNQDKAWYIIEACLRLMIDNDLNPIGDDFYSNQKLPPEVSKIYKRIVDGKEDI